MLTYLVACIVVGARKHWEKKLYYLQIGHSCSFTGHKLRTSQ